MLAINYIFKEMFANKTRLALTIIAIAWGTFSITSMLAIGEGLRLTFGAATQAGGHHLIVIRPGISKKYFRGQPKNTPIKIYQSTLNDIQQVVPGIDDLLGVNSFQAKLVVPGQHSYAMPYAVPPRFAALFHIQIVPPGRFINPHDEQLRRSVTVLGSKIAKNLFPKKMPLGQSLLLGGKPFTIIGVMKEQLQFGISPLGPPANQIWIPLSTYQSLTNSHNFNNILVTTNPKIPAKNITLPMQRVIANLNHVDPTDSAIIQSNDISAKQNEISETFIGLQIFLGFIGCITLIVAGAGIINIMYISVKQATRDIGVKMALGARRSDILIHYLLEALFVSFIGGIIGILLTYAVIEVINHIPIHAAFFATIGKPKPQLSWLVLWVVLITLGLIGLLSGIFPARHAASIQPVEALRSE